MRTILWSGDQHFVSVEDGVVAILVRDTEYQALLDGTVTPNDLDFKQMDDVTLTMQGYTTDVWEKPEGAKPTFRLVSKTRVHPRDIQSD